MRNRLLFIGGAFALALIILLLAIVFAPPAPVATPTITNSTSDGGLLPMAKAPSNSQNNSSEQPFANTENATVTRIDHGRRTVIHWQTLAPKGAGVSELTRPQATIYFATNRVTTIRADHATLVAPDNRIKRCHFVGHVVVTLFAANGRPANLQGISDIAARIYLHQASFDMELGQLSSPSHIYLTGPRVEFHGQGLKLDLNQLQHRINRLLIDRGQILRLHPASASPPPTQPSTKQGGTSGATSAKTKTASSTSATNRSAKTATATVKPEPAAHQPVPVIYYKARFLKNVHVSVSGKAVSMTADELDVLFSEKAKGGSGMAGLADADTLSSSHTMAVSSHSAFASAIRAAVLAAVGQNAPSSQPSLTQKGDGDVIIHWRGKLLVTPLDKKPSELRNPTDMEFVMSGKLAHPVHIDTGDGLTLMAAKFSYVTGSQAVRAWAGQGMPMIVKGKRMGTLTGAAMTIDPAAGTGKISGVGYIQQAAENGTQGLRVDWQKSLDLTFYPDKRDKKTSLAKALGAIRTAVFHGKVKAVHPQFNLQSQTLAVGFAKPQSSRGSHSSQNLKSIHAQGDVNLLSRQQQNKSLTVQCDDLEVGLTQSKENKPVPKGILARGHVQTNSGTMTLRSDQLDLSLAQASGDQRAQQTSSDQTLPQSSGLIVEQMIASDHVHVILAQKQVAIDGTQLVVNDRGKELQVFGNDKNPAIIVRPNGTLTGNHILMHRQSQTMDVPGSGQFEFAIDPKDPSATLTAKWKKSMHYDNHAGTASFLGHVETDTQSKTDRSHLTCQKLDLILETPSSKTSQSSTSPSPAHHSAQPDQGRLKRMKAVGSAVFTAQSQPPPSSPNSPPPTRLRVEGPIMTFNRDTQKIRVIGKGKMLVEDHRPANHQPASRTGINFGGRGDTLFVWDGQMVLDTAKNNMTLDKHVWMIHNAIPSKQKMTLSCDHLLATLKQTGSMGGMWKDHQHEQAQLKTVLADGNVRVRDGEKHIDSDHLKYVADKRTVMLWADKGGQVNIQSPNQPSGFSAKHIIWNLITNRLDAIGTAGGVEPIAK